MDKLGIYDKVDQIQSSIRELQNLINRSCNNESLIIQAAIKDADNAYDSLEQTKVLCQAYIEKKIS